MGLQNFIQTIANGRGVAKSNLYSVYFSDGGGSTSRRSETSGIISKLSAAGFNNINVRPGSNATGQVGQRVLLLCDEVTLPGVQSNVGNVVRYSGAAAMNYPTSPVYTDTQLSFICDAEMQSLKFLLAWRNNIYIESPPIGPRGEISYKLNYPDQYQCQMIIEKNERNETSDVGQTTLKYTLYNAWPYSVDSTPLSYGSSQLVKVTANFYYSHWVADTKIVTNPD